MSRYNDFDIVYGDYEDYTLTRRKMTFVSEKELLSQDEIDEVIELLKNPNPSWPFAKGDESVGDGL